jgi:hypothetical protein
MAGAFTRNGGALEGEAGAVLLLPLSLFYKPLLRLYDFVDAFFRNAALIFYFTNRRTAPFRPSQSESVSRETIVPDAK